VMGGGGGGDFELQQSQTACDDSQTVNTPLRPCTATVQSPIVSHIHQIQLTHYFTLYVTSPSDTGIFKFLCVRAGITDRKSKILVFEG